jgi:hypothetical protein
VAPIRDRSALLSHLDALGVPHAASIRELMERYGTEMDLYRRPMVHLHGARPLVPHQWGPMQTSPERTPDQLPPPLFHAYARVGEDARENHAATLAALVPLLGEPRERSVTNTVEHAWRFDTAELAIRIFPPELQDGRLWNPAHARIQELRTMCFIALRPGHYPLLSRLEREWMRSVEPLGSAYIADPPPDALLGSARRVPEDLRRDEPIVGISRDAGAIVGIGPRVGFVVEASRFRALVLQRIAPARGPGGASLDLVYADPFAFGEPPRRRTLATSAAIDGLDELARSLSTRFSIQLDTEHGMDD